MINRNELNHDCESTTPNDEVESGEESSETAACGSLLGLSRTLSVFLDALPKPSRSSFPAAGPFYFLGFV